MIIHKQRDTEKILNWTGSEAQELGRELVIIHPDRVYPVVN